MNMTRMWLMFPYILCAWALGKVRIHAVAIAREKGNNFTVFFKTEFFKEQNIVNVSFLFLLQH